MEPSDRFALEVRTVVVTWKAAVRSIPEGEGEGREEGAANRALQLLDSISERYAEQAASPHGRATLKEARTAIRSGDVSRTHPAGDPRRTAEK